MTKSTVENLFKLAMEFAQHRPRAKSLHALSAGFQSFRAQVLKTLQANPGFASAFQRLADQTGIRFDPERTVLIPVDACRVIAFFFSAYEFPSMFIVARFTFSPDLKDLGRFEFEAVTDPRTQFALASMFFPFALFPQFQTFDLPRRSKTRTTLNGRAGARKAPFIRKTAQERSVFG